MDTPTRALTKTTLVANLFEWYEFSIYGYLVGTIGQLFFKSSHPTLALIQAFALLAVSHLARPLGSLFFGAFGDRYGRRRSLQLSLMVMSFPTVLIGMLPTYSQIGGLATLCLLALKLIQGFGAGGERPVMGCYIFENAPPSRQGVLCSSVFVGEIIGSLFASFIVTVLMWLLPQEAIAEWGWRIPFLLGIPMTWYIFHVRKSIHELPDVVSQRRQALQDKTPVLAVVTSATGQLLKSVIFRALGIVPFYALVVWMPSYLHAFLGIPKEIALLTNTLTLCSMIFLYWGAGRLSDWAGYQRVLRYGTLALLVCIYPIFLGLQGQSFGVLLGIQLLFAVLLSSIDALAIQYLGDAFPPAIRCTGNSLSESLAASLFGSTMPIICTWLTYKTGMLTFPALYIMAFALLALPVVLRLRGGAQQAGA